MSYEQTVKEQKSKNPVSGPDGYSNSPTQEKVTTIKVTSDNPIVVAKLAHVVQAALKQHTTHSRLFFKPQEHLYHIYIDVATKTAENNLQEITPFPSDV